MYCLCIFANTFSLYWKKWNIFYNLVYFNVFLRFGKYSRKAMRRLTFCSRLSRTKLSHENVLCGVARNGKIRITILPWPYAHSQITSDNWSTTNGHVTPFDSQRFSLLAKEKPAFSPLNSCPFLRSSRIPFCIFEISLFVGIKEVKTACAFASHAYFREEECRKAVVPF